MAELQFLTSPKGHTIAYRHQPAALGIEGPGVLFCCGFQSDMNGDKALALEAECQRQGRQFTRFDYMAHGQSSGDFAEGTISQWRDDALQVLDEVTRGQQLIVGSSMGGWIMLLTALARPERIHSLIGLAAAPDFTKRFVEEELTPEQAVVLQSQGYFDVPNCYDENGVYRMYNKLVADGTQNNTLLDKVLAIDVPVRLLHAVDDEDVPWRVGGAIIEQMTGNNGELRLLKTGGHRLSDPASLALIVETLNTLLDS